MCSMRKDVHVGRTIRDELDEEIPAILRKEIVWWETYVCFVKRLRRYKGTWRTGEVTWGFDSDEVSRNNALMNHHSLSRTMSHLLFPWWIRSKGNGMWARNTDELVIPRGNHFSLRRLLLALLLPSDHVSRLMEIVSRRWRIVLSAQIVFVLAVSYKHPVNFDSGQLEMSDRQCSCSIVWIVSFYSVNLCPILLDWFVACRWRQRHWSDCC